MRPPVDELGAQLRRHFVERFDLVVAVDIGLMFSFNGHEAEQLARIEEETDEIECPECNGDGSTLPAGACGGCEFCPAPQRCVPCQGTGVLRRETTR